MKHLGGALIVIVALGCASGPSPVPTLADSVGQPSAGVVGPSAEAPAGPSGTLEVVLTNIAGDDLDGRVELLQDAKTAAVVSVARGHGRGSAPAGAYRAYIYALDDAIPVLVGIQDLQISAGKAAAIRLELTEGSGSLSLLHFDQDYDFVLDRVELEVGTDPTSPLSFPGAMSVPLPAEVLNPNAKWYAGELHAHSHYDPYGTEPVADLIRRAEQAGLEFLAIADRNTLRACQDPAYKSSRLALIPAMEWGNNEKGVALIYGPRTMPGPVGAFGDAQAMMVRLQAQGAFVAIAHPCFPTMPWQWGLSYMGGVEVWAREFSGVPPAVLQDLDEPMLERRDNILLHSLARAVATKNQSANGQASLFYDMELVRQLKAAAIAGSMSGSPKVPIGQPVTYIYARNLSAPALLEGLIMGRTFVSSSKDGPRVFMTADVMNDGSIDVPMVGGSVPIGVPVRFEVLVFNAKGKKMQLLRNGMPERSQWVDSENYAWSYMRVPDAYSDFRVRIVDTVEDHRNQYGHLKVLAMTSPIYAENILPQIVGPNVNPDLFRLRIKSYYDDYNRIQREGLPADPTPYEIKLHRR